MKRFLGFNPMQYGDLFMGTVAARALKRAVPDSHLTYVINGDYREAAPLFIDHPHIDRVHVLHSPRGGFDEVDQSWVAERGFHHVFNPMQDHDHSRPWWRERSQPHEVVHMHGLPMPIGDTGQIKLVKWFTPSTGTKGAVALAPFPAFYAGLTNDKAFPIELAQSIVWYLRGKGVEVLQVGGPNEPALKDAAQIHTGYFDSVRNVLGCRAFIGGDSGMMWLMSGYSFPCLGLYASRYYGREHVKHIQPVNPNAIYLHEETMGQFSLDIIRQSIDAILA